MTDRRYLLAFVAALATAFLATFGVWRTIDRGPTAAEELRPVVVAARDLPGGSALDARALQVVRWPAASVPAGAQATPDSLVGRVLRGDVPQGAPLLGGQLAPVGARAGLEGEIAAGHRAMAVRVSDAAGQAGLVRADSRVDVLVAARDDAGREGMVARLVMSDVRVLAVGTRAEQTQADGKPAFGATAQSPIVTLEVTPAQAEALAAVESQGQIQLVLRAFGSRERIATAGTNARAVLGLPPIPEPVMPAPIPIAPPAPAPVVVAPPPAAEPEPMTTVQVFRGTAPQAVQFPRTAPRATSP